MKSWRALAPLVLLTMFGGFDTLTAGFGPTAAFAQTEAPLDDPADTLAIDEDAIEGGAEVEAEPVDTSDLPPLAANFGADTPSELSVEALALTIDNTILFICAVLVLFMQAGFAMVEAGFNSQKNVVNILFKNLMDICIGVMLYAVIGFNMMYPGSDYAGGYIPPMTNFLLSGEDTAGPAEAPGYDDEGKAGYGLLYHGQTDFLFQVAFAATAATIVSGAVAGRMKFESYLIYSALLTGFIYPFSGYWKWGGGWLDAMEFQDFAGSCVVHAVGGFAGLAGAIVLGPRLGRYTADGKSVPLPGHSIAIATLGVFILWVGWYGFNPGSQLTFSGEGNVQALSKVAVNTTLSAAAGGFMAMIVSWCMFSKPDISMALNGVLGGLVGITANCDAVTNFSAVVIGLVSGVLVVLGILMLDKLKIDDPVGAWPVHGLCGMWGCLCMPIFAGAAWKAQIIGTLSYCAWAFVTMFVVFLVLKAVGLLRVSPEDEERGLDISEHGMAAYSTT